MQSFDKLWQTLEDAKLETAEALKEVQRCEERALRAADKLLRARRKYERLVTAENRAHREFNKTRKLLYTRAKDPNDLQVSPTLFGLLLKDKGVK